MGEILQQQSDQQPRSSEGVPARGMSKKGLWFFTVVVIVLIVLVVLFMMMGNSSSNETAITSLDNIVTYTSDGYLPGNIMISPGGTVTWKNDSDITITVDSDPHPVHTSYPEFNLGSVQAGGELRFTFPNVGEYNYHNHLKASQVGTVTVE
ncbi:hypothetical protein IID19_04090 [Patescibacteria group bacterium]|nr:hypothetical protein [Patescibacteria group bacterium]